MAEWIQVRQLSSGTILLGRVKWCASHICRLIGLMFRRRLAADEGLLLVEADESRWGSSIHMWFVFTSLGVIWLDSHYRVVDVKVARPWLVYFPSTAARYILETRPEVIERVAVGDTLEFIHA